jgi:hypothetical protein
MARACSASHVQRGCRACALSCVSTFGKTPQRQDSDEVKLHLQEGKKEILVTLRVK